MRKKNIHSVTTQVRAIEKVSNNIKIFTLTDPDDWPLPQFNPGSHIDVFLYGGKVRQYSLCGNPENIGKYKENFYQRLAFDEIFSTFLVFI